ncbi:MAG: hypothetical protein EB009_04415 [Actinobacteria bacterium]|nr:hypothetical protein [Actinomycetota bacterium]NBO48081.1 hypothetical protein [Actinomycetota bacterium]NBP22914.1 hypothetical protein [Actinomycetota bacterium]NBP43592.1 hypothetical protein [Actinomycetota bacterium]NBQ01620.1 hypothetical protein [Actinomycetota bacterium]
MSYKSNHHKLSIYEKSILIAELSAALWVHIAVFEITLRKFLHSSLSKSYKTNRWWLTSNLLTAKDRAGFEYSEKRLALQKRKVTPILVVHNSSFSLCIELLSKRYHQKIWMKLLKYFPTYPGRREDFYKRAREIRNLRNLIAHHAPILHRNLLRDHQYLHELTMILDPQLAQEVQKRSRVLDLLLNARLVGSGGGI